MSYTGNSPGGAIIGSAQVQDGSLDYADLSSASQLALLSGGMRNLLINPLFNVNQRGYAGGAVGAGNTYTYDRWRVVTSGQSAPLSGIIVTAPAGGMEQVVEGANIIGGTYCLSWTGTAVAQVNGSTVANGGTVSLTGGANATVKFIGGTVSLPQLERGSIPTVFDQRFVGSELAMCQRYFQRYSQLDSPGSAQAAAYAAIDHLLPVAMRATPTLTFQDDQGAAGQVQYVSTNGSNLSRGVPQGTANSTNLHLLIWDTAATKAFMRAFNVQLSAEF